jgi:hypothetical protein
MPIKPENRGRYPKNWKEVRKKILARARNRCEQCGKPDRQWIHVADDGVWFDFDIELAWRDSQGRVTQAPACDTIRQIFVVLTVAHYPDSSPENCNEDNLHCLCARCHIVLDTPARIKDIAATRRRKLEEAGQLKLF